jgi:hypothetical protein
MRSKTAAQLTTHVLSWAVVLFPSADSARAQQTPRPIPEYLRTVIAEARTAIPPREAAKWYRGHRLAVAQAYLGDPEGARETARYLQLPWSAWSQIASAQRSFGDHAGALATVHLALSPADRTQAAGSLASEYARARSYEQAILVARSLMELPSRAAVLRTVAIEMRRRDAPRAADLVSELVAMTQSDTSSWARAFEVELALDQAAIGDIAGALRVAPESLEPAVRAERLARIAGVLKSAKAVSNASASADAVLQEAIRTVELLPDLKQRETLRSRVLQRYRFTMLMSGGSGRTSTDQPPPPLNHDSAFAAIADHERNHDYHSATAGLRVILGRYLDFGMFRPPDGLMFPAVVDTLVTRAIANADRVSVPFADSTRHWSVDLLVRRSHRQARTMAGEVRDSVLRSSAMRKVALGRLASDRGDALRYAATIPLPVLRDSAYWAASRALSETRPSDARRITGDIADAHLRGEALAAVAYGTLVRADTTRARALYRSAFSLMGPLPPYHGTSLLWFPLALGEWPPVVAWVHRLATPEQKAEGLVLILETAVQLSRAGIR